MKSLTYIIAIQWFKMEFVNSQALWSNDRVIGYQIEYAHSFWTHAEWHKWHYESGWIHWELRPMFIDFQDSCDYTSMNYLNVYPSSFFLSIHCSADKKLHLLHPNT